MGGTFTDLVLLDPERGRLTYYKEPSTPAEPSLAVERGVQGVMARAGIAADDVELIVHGTTLGLNTIIQRRGARMALIVSRGNRDILELARLQIPNSFDMFGAKELPLVSRDLVFEVSARCRVDGTIDGQFNPGEVSGIAARLREIGIASVAVVLLNSYRHPQLESQVATLLRAELPDALVTESAQIWPEMREYERAMVTALNAYIHPQLNAYFTRLSQRLTSIAIKSPIYITANNGGTIGIATARERPIDTVLSGPASGVVASCEIATTCNCSHFVSVDMGGTSSDMSLTVGGQPEYSTQSVVGEFPLILPVVNVSAIGAGGGSIAWVDELGVLKVGPRSAGADPGPICYGRGGREITITDCYLALGVIRPDGFLSGRMKLDREASVAALTQLADSLRYTGPDGAVRAAEAVLQVATAKMATEVRRGFAQRGLDPRDFALVALGGAGPTHANLLAADVGLPSILVPMSPGTLCAMGAVVSDLKRDFVRTVRHLLEPALVSRLQGHIDDIRNEARLWLDAEQTVLGAAARTNWTAELRYPQEGIGLTVTLQERLIDVIDLGGIADTFHAEHRRIYGFHDDASRVELLTLHAQVIGPVARISLPPAQRPSGTTRRQASRQIFTAGQWREVDVYQRNELFPGEVVLGPAVVEQEDTTIWILEGWRGTVNSSGILQNERLSQ